MKISEMEKAIKNVITSYIHIINEAGLEEKVLNYIPKFKSHEQVDKLHTFICGKGKDIYTDKSWLRLLMIANEHWSLLKPHEWAFHKMNMPNHPLVKELKQHVYMVRTKWYQRPRAPRSTE